MQVIDNRALRLQVRNADKFSVLPNKHISPIEGGFEVYVKWGLDEVRVLRNLGHADAPSPIRKNYNWPGRYKPMSHQRDTADFSTIHRRAFILNDAGTGKTLSALWAADYLMTQGHVRRVLIVCPVSIMQSAWMGDLNQSVIHRSAIVAHHTDAKRRVAAVKGDYEFVIVNYDGVALIRDAVRADGRFDLIIVDEATAYSNPSTMRWKMLNSLLQSNTMLWMMTGTPAAQSPEQAYGLAKLVNPAGVPAYKGAWRDKVMVKISQFKWAPRINAKALVHAALQPAIRFSKAQCLDLPPVITQTRDVAMSPQQAKYYKLIKDQMVAQAAGERITAVNKGVMVGKLLQISAGSCRTDDGDVVEFDAAPRLNVLLEVVKEASNKFLVFATHTATINRLHEFLNKHGHNVAIIDGNVPMAKRGDIINKFQFTDELDGLVMQPKAAAHGLTLTRADAVIFYGPVDSVEQYIQGIARSDRKGQVADKVTVTHIQNSPAERVAFKRLEMRVNDSELLSGMFDEVMKE
jgi:superfamily II DNA or RNA helicase